MQQQDIEMISLQQQQQQTKLTDPREVSISIIPNTSRNDLVLYASAPSLETSASEITMVGLETKESSSSPESNSNENNEQPPPPPQKSTPANITQKKQEYKEPERMSWKHYFLHVMTPIWHSFPNKVSEARDMLAAERTALSWQRTAYAILAIGIGVSRLNRKGHDPFVPKALGVLTAVISLLLIMYAHLRFYVVMKSMVDRKYL
ncbi:hypothetical protein C9374_014612 [Naegleria lovaniensis]|uniref:DUF202 domain-containing protein n=1 Tax=Naegleria lovaniensis TaxID=51637 RepID=A0AA88GUN9_NAELO|nr:uncharacterized protein C9374_014612 [Naegleria lovaniensis]KAG2389212.1 hypothetical protein C9374_014612 [Naegleria lovaniensis]